jgi:hypothetical protein
MAVAAENVNVEISRAVTESELREIMQAHFRRFVASARLTQDARTGEPVVLVEFVAKVKGVRS